MPGNAIWSVGSDRKPVVGREKPAEAGADAGADADAGTNLGAVAAAAALGARRAPTIGVRAAPTISATAIARALGRRRPRPPSRASATGTELALASLPRRPGFDIDSRISLPARHPAMPVCGVQTIEDVSTQAVRFAEQWMIEILLGVAAHAQALHHLARALIAHRGERNDLPQLALAEAERQRRRGRLARKAPTPVGPCQAPADLDSGREGNRDVHGGEARESDEELLLRKLDRPEAVAPPLEARLRPLDHRDALGSRERRREVLHHVLVGVHRGKRLAVACQPAPQQQPLRPQSRADLHARDRRAGRLVRVRSCDHPSAPASVKAPSGEPRLAAHAEPAAAIPTKEREP